MIGRIRKIGKILHLSNLTKDILIIKLDELVRLGTIIYDADMNPLGTIIEIFGPVASPYARVKLKDSVNRDSLKKLYGSDCYIIVGEEEKVRWRKQPKRHTSKFARR